MSTIVKETIYVDGNKKAMYPFEVHSIASVGSNFEGCKCVYIYSKKTNEIYEHLYVGQTENLARRFKEHETGDTESDKCIQKSGATHILVNNFECEDKRKAVESEILTSNPCLFKCNIQRR